MEQNGALRNRAQEESAAVGPGITMAGRAPAWCFRTLRRGGCGARRPARSLPVERRRDSRNEVSMVRPSPASASIPAGGDRPVKWLRRRCGPDDAPAAVLREARGLSRRRLWRSGDWDRSTWRPGRWLGPAIRIGCHCGCGHSRPATSARRDSSPGALSKTFRNYKQELAKPLDGRFKPAVCKGELP